MLSRFGCGNKPGCCPTFEGVQQTGEPGGTWYWMRSPEEEKRVVMGLYNRYCIRCHGVDGRGVWDIPDVPDFTNARWQACRSDAQLARAIIEGRGAVMPPFRGTVTREEGWALARTFAHSYLEPRCRSRMSVSPTNRQARFRKRCQDRSYYQNNRTHSVRMSLEWRIYGTPDLSSVRLLP